MKKLRGQSGFSAVELVLIVVVIGVIAGVGFWVLKQRSANKQTDNSQASTSHSSTSTAKAGTTDSIDQLTKSDEAADSAIDKTHDATEQSNAASSNTAQNNIGDSYNEANF
jgi:uncharacterized protein HemX